MAPEKPTNCVIRDNPVTVVEETEMDGLFPNWLLAAMPGAYAWQIYGFWWGVAMFVAVLILLVMVAWRCVFREWSRRRYVMARAMTVIASMVVIGLSAAERCDATGAMCVSIWS